MKVDLLTIADCPNSVVAHNALRQALDATGRQNVPIEVTEVGSPATAARLGFAGSPTILVDGTDLFPSDGSTESLACRVYPTPAGLAGAPTTQQIEQALTGR